jgi:hypothetical protein
MPGKPRRSAGGRSTTLADVQKLAREKSGGAIETLAAIHADAKAPAAVRVAAANAILDRAFGKPQAVTGEDGEGPILANLTVTFVKPPATDRPPADQPQADG